MRAGVVRRMLVMMVMAAVFFRFVSEIFLAGAFAFMFFAHLESPLTVEPSAA